MQNYLGESPVIDGASLTPIGNKEGLISIINASHIRIIGFEIKNFATDGGPTPIGIYVEGTCTDIAINNNEIHDIKNNSTCSGDDCPEGAHGIGVFGTTSTGITDIHFDNNKVYGCIYSPAKPSC